MRSTKKERIGWYFYDWANSVFYTTVVTVFLGPYLTTIAKNAADINGLIYLAGLPIKAGSFFPYIISLSVLLQVVILPWMGAIADFSNNKKLILGIFAYVGSLATICLYFLQGSNFLLGGFLFIVANLSYGITIVIYNSFLNDIASPDKRDSVSSIGWAFGYLGGGVLLALNLVLYLNAEALNISKETAVRICLSSAGVWWAIFTLVPLINLKKRTNIKQANNNISLFKTGISQLFKTISDARNYPMTLMFLLAYVLYNDGVQSVITMSAVFGQEELGLDLGTLTIVILMVQFVAFIGSLFFNIITKKIGAKKSILINLIIWIAIILYSFGILVTKFEFFVAGFVIALVLGATQGLSRSYFSHLIPKGKEAEYFSLYEISERGTSWLGPLIFGLTLQFTGKYRLAILSLIIFFILGFVILLKFNTKKAIIDAGNELPKII